MTGLKTDQFECDLDKIYSLKKFSDDFRYKNPNIFIDGGKVNIYTSEETPATKADMVLENEDVENHSAFSIIPNYIYFEESVATVANVILTGVEPTSVS